MLAHARPRSSTLFPDPGDSSFPAGFSLIFQWLTCPRTVTKWLIELQKWAYSPSDQREPRDALKRATMLQLRHVEDKWTASVWLA
ncbi:hypothetical protein TgHK011_002025 [Trichoderma gracile]|nr:hypothetical protein TgHK011_002025 [Trichoderma gracile]